MTTIDLLENAAKKYGNRIAYQYKEDSISFAEVKTRALAVAGKICSMSEEKQPIVVISGKNVNIPSIYLGVAYSNCYYVPVSTEMPKAKVESILGITESKIIITDEENKEFVSSLDFAGEILLIDQCVGYKNGNLMAVEERKKRLIDKNPLYVIFTSGSTGVPKGVVTCHDAVTDYLNTFVQTFDITEDEVMGNQAPLDYIAGIRDIYIPLIVGCKSIFIPKNYFSTPKILFEYINENKVTTICWVSAALSLCCQLNVFDEIKPEYIKKVFFTGSVFESKYLNMWKAELPNVMFVNHYGPTEITASCTYYVVDNSIEYQKPAPIGKAFANREVFILNEDNKIAGTNEHGEICVSGTCLALGYYKNEEKTKECFVQNPLNSVYPQLIYRTGDIGYVNENGDMVFVGRKDNQIKHMGHRVELGEVEDFASQCEGVKEVCCVYNKVKSVITLYYSGTATARDISKFLRIQLPSYMIPRKLIALESLPKLFNGKIDRQTLIKKLDEE